MLFSSHKWGHALSAAAENNEEQREKPTRKQQQRSIQTQQKLLDAALEAFSENGFKGTSTRDIAERAGVHHPLITYHFKNKEELWRASADRIFTQFNNALRQARQESQGLCPRSRMASMIRAYVNCSATQPALHKVIVQEASHPSDRLDWLVEKHLRPLSKIAVQELKNVQRQGIAPEGDPALLFNMIRASTGGLMALGLELKGTSDIDLQKRGAVDELAEMIIRVFLPNEAPDNWRELEQAG